MSAECGREDSRRKIAGLIQASNFDGGESAGVELRRVRGRGRRSRGTRWLYFFLAELEDDDHPGLFVVIVPFPNLCVLLLEPSERSVIVPFPNVRVVPVTVWPLLLRSVVMMLPPNFRVVVVDPSDHRVIVPVPNFCVTPVIACPLGERSVVMVPLPNF